MSSIDYGARLAALRRELSARDLAGFVVPICDEHMSEYVGAYAQRLAWLTGFAGSAGTAAILPDRAAMFTDGRYTLQVRQQVDGAAYDFIDVPGTSVGEWLAAHAPTGARIGYDPWLHSIGWARSTAAALKRSGAALVAVADNVIDAVWTDQPERSMARAMVYPDALAGQTSADKRAAIGAAVRAAGGDVAVISALDSIAWTFNLRGDDIDHTPVALAFALVAADGSARLFIHPDKVDDGLRAHLGNGVSLAPYDSFASALGDLGGQKILVDPERCVAAIFTALDAAGAKIIRLRDPAVLPKACKNPTEIAGMRAAHIRDGVAVTRFLHWFANAAPHSQWTEAQVAEKLLSFRQASGALRDLSFDTISAAAGNAASPHYRFDPAAHVPLPDNGIYLVDSGGQYDDGTTDITRTLATGTPTADMRRRFTQVLKGHIALARARFPQGTRGSQLDSLARQFLWADGADYAHGTGHGVGAYLAVHEGPQRIAKASGGQAGTDEPLAPGMIISNEPGYYKAGEYGIRIENLVLVVAIDTPGAESPVLGFDTISFAPIDRTLIDPALMTADEIGWLDAYHARVMALIGPQLDGDEGSWLARACAPLAADAAPALAR